MKKTLWSLYIHTNKINNKKYIGITSKKCKRRWGTGGNKYKTSTYFYNSIQKYGWDNIEHEIIQTDLTEIEAKGLEIEFIKKYKTNNKKFGYNLTIGGDGTNGYKLSVEHIQLIKDRNVGNSYALGHIVSKETRVIMSNCKLGKKLEIYHIEKIRKALLNGNNSKKVYQYDKKCKLLKVWESVGEAGRNGYMRSKVSACCNKRRKIHGDCIWSFVKLDKQELQSKLKRQRNKIYQYDKDIKLIKIFDDIYDCINNGFNRNKVYEVCRESKQFYRGYKWSYKIITK